MDVEASCASFHFAGVDCVGHAVGGIAEGDPTPLSFRSMGSEHTIAVPKIHFDAVDGGSSPVRAVCSHSSPYWWQDESGHRHEIQVIRKRGARGPVDGPPVQVRHQ